MLNKRFHSLELANFCKLYGPPTVERKFSAHDSISCCLDQTIRQNVDISFRKFCREISCFSISLNRSASFSS